MLLVSAALFVANKSTAQVSVQVNIGDQPEWGPAGYAYAEYYYMPDIEAYYYVPRRQFVYLSGGQVGLRSFLAAHVFTLQHIYRV